MCGLSWLQVQSKLLGGGYSVASGGSWRKPSVSQATCALVCQGWAARTWRAATYHASDELWSARCWLLAGMEGDGLRLSCNLYEVGHCPVHGGDQGWGACLLT